MSDTVRTETDGVIARLTIDRPDRRNALDRATLDALEHSIDAVTADDSVKVVVLTGAGGHFCAGADLSSVEDAGFADALRRVLLGLAEGPKPAVAVIEGAALGAGTQLAVACDLRCATPDSTFGIPAGRLGLMVDQWTVQRLALDGGFGTARGMLVGALRYSGEQLHHVGFVHRLGDASAGIALAEQVAELAPLTVAGHKLGLRRLEADTSADPEYRAAFQRAWGSADVGEGMAAFREKRSPRFEGR